MEQRRRLPPVLNDKSLFTKAAPYGDRGDQGYHSPCNRIGVNYSPASGAAASLLFEEYPQVRVNNRPCCSSSPGLLKARMVSEDFRCGSVTPPVRRSKQTEFCCAPDAGPASRSAESLTKAAAVKKQGHVHVWRPVYHTQAS
jgi:hypothetical protein